MTIDNREDSPSQAYPCDAAAGIAQHYLSLGPEGFHRVAYRLHGDRDNPRTVICVHGLTGNAHDFDALAAALAAEYRVVCPDVVGRGDSARFETKESYSYANYANDLAVLIAHLAVDEVDWVGTSMGGLLGMMLAAQPGSPIRRMLLNDVGPFLPKTALERIAVYLGEDPPFATLDQAEAYLREVHAPFGALSDAQWRFLALHRTRPQGDGWRLHYDPRIAWSFKENPPQDLDLWPVWDQIRCPIRVLRGTESDLLSAETAHQMQGRGPAVELVEIEGVGHAPMLMDAAQIQIVRDWLAS